MSRRELLVVAALCIALAFTVATSSVSSVEADRTVSIEVVDDQHAYLGVDQDIRQTANGTVNVNVAIQNQHPSETALRQATVTVDGTTAEMAENSRFKPGDSRSHTFNSVSCGSSITIEATGMNGKITIERTITCE